MLYLPFEWIDSMENDVCRLGIGLDKDFFRAIHEVKADLQRRTTARLLWRSRVGCKCNHDFPVICIDRANFRNASA